MSPGLPISFTEKRRRSTQPPQCQRLCKKNQKEFLTQPLSDLFRFYCKCKYSQAFCATKHGIKPMRKSLSGAEKIRQIFSAPPFYSDQHPQLLQPKHTIRSAIIIHQMLLSLKRLQRQLFIKKSSD